MQLATGITDREQWALDVFDFYGVRAVKLLTGKFALVLTEEQSNTAVKQAYEIMGGASWMPVLLPRHMTVPKQWKDPALYQAAGSDFPVPCPEELVMPWD